MKFRGVTRHQRSNGKVSFVARLYIDRKNYKSIYGFDTAEEAALAYDQMAREYSGKSAALNFPSAGEKTTKTVSCVQCGSRFEVSGQVPRRDRAICSEKCRVDHRIGWQRCWRKENQEAIDRYNRSRKDKYRANPEVAREQKRAWWAAKVEKDPSLRERKRAYMIEWATKNSERVRAQRSAKNRAESAAIAALRNLGISQGDM